MARGKKDNITIEAKLTVHDLDDIPRFFCSFQRLFSQFSLGSELAQLGSLGSKGIVRNYRDTLILGHLLNLCYQGINEPITYDDRNGRRKLNLIYR